MLLVRVAGPVATGAVSSPGSMVARLDSSLLPAHLSGSRIVGVSVAADDRRQVVRAQLNLAVPAVLLRLVPCFVCHCWSPS